MDRILPESFANEEELNKQLLAACDEVQEALGEEYVAYLAAVLEGEEDGQLLQDYAAGCRLGAELMWEGRSDQP